jgi:F-type H+-transporting ATPase subunit b
MHRCCSTAGRAALAVAALLVSASAALAAEGARPEPNTLEPRFDLTIWSIVVFALLFAVLYKFAWGPILEGLKKREKDIAGAIDEAKRVHEEMTKQRADFERQLSEANQQIPQLLEQARRDAEQLKEEMRAQAAADIQAERQRLRREIDTARDQAVDAIWKQAANLATLVSARVLRKTLTAEDQHRLNEEALAEIKEVSQENEQMAQSKAEAWVRRGGGKA